ncbi:MAG TPA: cytochrome b/b6 domain-containing protein [Aromatoleum sp.]|uniref:cytochrome b/b6 domain-containing protein n=1 Tax=Aromatoleum sp. TaxID=2307007 RepID=UPI002B4950C4|nr:cytochrome b/b6 domain-containing protein [Aromatoleum sp.]HJV26222.1 cytochrome b/b6 domain-containing protein [Aromatoleum sp.]
MTGDRIKVWDLPVRVFHWGLVAMVATAYLTSEDAEAPHRWAGYIVLALLAFRVVWGFVGSAHARFADFVPRPAVLRDYVGCLLRGREPRHLGHNPAAAVMILFLMAMLGLIGATGWLMTTDWGWGSELLEELHEGAVNLTLAAVVLHVAAAVFESVRHRENLVRAMITGYKRR